MNIDSVRELKDSAIRKVLSPMVAAPIRSLNLAYSATDISLLPNRNKRIMAIGIAPGKSDGDFKLAVRVQRPELMASAEVERLKKLSHGEIDLRFVGEIKKRAKPWYQTKKRPLLIGSSVAHFQVTAGTIGGFVKSKTKSDSRIFLLSNNHVIANEDKAVIGDPILQQAPFDGGNAKDQVATLAKFVKFKKKAPNAVDCAIAEIDSDIDIDSITLKGVGKLSGIATDVDEGLEVIKIGRTTGITRGKVTAFELDDVVVGFDQGNLTFNGQIEVEGGGDRPFSRPGDSGSLVYNTDLKAIGLLFAGTDVGGTNGMGVTYINPIENVLRSLNVELIW
jgi:hypothetical protein